LKDRGVKVWKRYEIEDFAGDVGTSRLRLVGHLERKNAGDWVPVSIWLLYKMLEKADRKR